MNTKKKLDNFTLVKAAFGLRKKSSKVKKKSIFVWISSIVQEEISLTKLTKKKEEEEEVKDIFDVIN